MTFTSANTIVVESSLTLSDQESIEIHHSHSIEQGGEGVCEKLPGLIVMDSPDSTAPSTPSESFQYSEVGPFNKEMKDNDINERHNCDCVFSPLTESLNEKLQGTSIIKAKKEQQHETTKNSNINSEKIEYTGKNTTTNEATSVDQSGEPQLSSHTEDENKNNANDDDDSVVLGPIEFFRKSIVAVTGTAMLGVGAVLVPAPVPLGIPVIAGGLALLSTEFPESVDKITESTRQKLVDVLEEDTGDEHDIQVPNEDDSNLESSKQTKETTPVPNTFQENFNKTKRDIQKNVRNTLLPWLRKDAPKQEMSSLSGTKSSTSEGN